MTIPNRYVYWTGSLASDFGSQLTGGNLVQGSSSIEIKPATGTMINPAVRFNFSNNFYTSGTFAGVTNHSGSFVIFKMTSSLPARYRIMFDKTEHYLSTSVNATTPEIQFGFLFGATNVNSQEDVSSLCGWAIMFNRSDVAPVYRIAMIENGLLRWHTNSSFSSFGFGSSSIQHFVFDVSMNSRLGSITGGSYFDVWGRSTGRSDRANEVSNWVNINRRNASIDTELTCSGDKWQNKVLNSAYIICCNYFTGTASRGLITGSFVELENLAILAHPMGPSNGRSGTTGW